MLVQNISEGYVFQFLTGVCVCMCVCVCVCVCFVNCFKSDYQYSGILLSVGIGPTHTSSGGKYQGFGNMPAPKSKA